MTSEQIWVLKVFIKILLVAFIGIMIFRIWYWMDNCVINRISVYPLISIYHCNVNPFDVRDSYIDNLIEKQERDKVMTDWAGKR